jgi:hypothetical protein
LRIEKGTIRHANGGRRVVHSSATSRDLRPTLDDLAKALLRKRNGKD